MMGKINTQETISKVIIGGQEADLGSEYSVEDAIQLIGSMGMGNHIAGAQPVVTNGVLSFQQTNGEKG